MQFETLKFDNPEPGIGVITMNRPERLNALNLNMLDKTPLGLRLTKETIAQNLNAPSLEAAMELENRNQSILCLTPEFFEAVLKFGKRKTDGSF
jgi:enoyl-CoA hydratase/carnithine racemase